jgi:hypothetical protein
VSHVSIVLAKLDGQLLCLLAHRSRPEIIDFCPVAAAAAAASTPRAMLSSFEENSSAAFIFSALSSRPKNATVCVWSTSPSFLYLLISSTERREEKRFYVHSSGQRHGWRKRRFASSHPPSLLASTRPPCTFEQREREKAKASKRFEFFHIH